MDGWADRAGTGETVTAERAQDALRPLRYFVAALSGATGDQTWAEQDAYAVNTPRQFATQGPQGVAVEGRPVLIAPPDNAAPKVPPWVLIGGAVALAFVLKRAM